MEKKEKQKRIKNFGKLKNLKTQNGNEERVEASLKIACQTYRTVPLRYGTWDLFKTSVVETGSFHHQANTRRKI